jgi:MoaA/NifB/PqqE/SkfB family radical SAM enzyme
VETHPVRDQPTRAPVAFDIELTNRCNIVCAMCPREKITRPFGAMDDATFGRLLDQLREVQRRRRIAALWLTGFGDNLLHPDVARYVGELKRALAVSVGLVTNGVSLTRDLCRALTAAGLDALKLSVHSLPHNHDRIVRGASFDDVLARVRLAVAEMPERVGINCVELPLNEADREAFQAFWRREGVRQIEFYPVHTRGGQLTDETLVKLRKPPEDCNIFLPIQFVAWNGDFLSCCSDLSGTTRLGSVLTSDLEAVLDEKERIGNPRKHFAYCQGCRDEYPAERIRKPSATERA